MGNARPSIEEISAYIREGWHFRHKIVKGRRYITRRKGQTERGVGPFNPELWDSINQLLEEHTSGTKAPSTRTFKKMEAHEQRQSELLKAISLDRASIMMTTCKNSDREGFCTFWKWEREPRFFTLFKELYDNDSIKRKRMSLDGKTVYRWVARTFLWYCLGCAAYIPT